MPTMFRITSNSKQFLRDLSKRDGGMQKVTAATLTDTAQAVTKRSERNLKRDMIIRSPGYTLGSLKTYKASPSRPIARQDSVAGTISPYLPIHDEGGKIRARRKVIAVPTNRVRGADRKKKIPKRYIGPIASAFILRPTKHPDTPRIRGGRAVPYRLKRAMVFIRQGRRIFPIYDIEKDSYQLKATHWHTEAVGKYGNWDYMAQVFRRQARKLLRGAR